MPNSGVTSTTVDRLAIGPAIVYRGANAIGTLAASAKAEEIVEWRRPRIAGLGVPLEGTDRSVSRTLRITGEFLEHSAAEAVKWTAGVNAGGVVTPPDVGVFFTAGQYDDEISFRFFLGNTNEFLATMPSGIVTGYPFAGQDPGEGASTVTWEARGAVGTPDDAPYTYRFVQGNPDLPLTAQSDLVLAPPLNLGAGAQTFAMLIGPDAQLGSTSGGDTNDPTYVAGPPKRFTFDANDYITFGDVLDAVFINAAGFTIIHAMRTPVDQSGNKAMINKNNADPQYGFRFQTDEGSLHLLFSHDGTMANRTEYFDTTAGLTADTKYIAAMSYNPGAARASRCKLYVDGVPRTVGNTLNGSDGPGIDNTGELRVGMSGNGELPTGRESSLFYIWDRVLSDGEVEDATDEIDALAGGWL